MSTYRKIQCLWSPMLYFGKVSDCVQGCRPCLSTWMRDRPESGKAGRGAQPRYTFFWTNDQIPALERVSCPLVQLTRITRGSTLRGLAKEPSYSLPRCVAGHIGGEHVMFGLGRGECRQHNLHRKGPQAGQADHRAGRRGGFGGPGGAVCL